MKANLNIGDNRKWLFALLIPIFLQTILQGLMGNVDTYIISHYSEEAVAAIGYSDKVIKVLQRVFSVLSAGIVIIVPQLLGAKDEKGAKSAAGSAICFTLLVGGLVSLILFQFGDSILMALGVSDGMYEYASIYFRIVSSSLVFYAITLIITGILRCYNMAAAVLIVSIFTNIVNLIGDYVVVYYSDLFIFRPVTGVALVTLISQFLGTCILFLYMVLKIKIRTWKIKIKELFYILKVGFPAIGESLSYTMSQLIITIIITNLGNSVLVANIFAMNIMILVSRMSYCMGTVTSIMIGKLVGARDIAGAEKTCYFNLKWAIISNFIWGIIPVIYSAQIISIFSRDSQIIRIAQIFMIFEFFTLIFKSCNFIFGDALRGSGDVVFPAAIGIISMWLISVAGSFILSKTIGVIGICIAFLLDEGIRAVVLGLRWKKGKWKLKALSKGKGIYEKY